MLNAIADEDQNRMGLVAYLTSAAQSQHEENKANKDKKEVRLVICKMGAVRLTLSLTSEFNTGRK